MLAVQSYDGGFYWLHTDHLGNGRKLTNTSGTVVYRAEFDPHGQILYEWQSSGQTYLNSHKFTGYERDWSTNLNYAKARTYNHNRARFLQPDPLGIGAADPSNPQSLNLYSYVENDPANFVDPSGLNKVCFYAEFEHSYVTPDGSTIVIRTILRFDGCFDYGGGGGGGGVVVNYGGGGSGAPVSGSQNGQSTKEIAKCLERVINFSALSATICSSPLPPLDCGRLFVWNESLIRVMSVMQNGHWLRLI
jgi:RHS repeat-associated protein